MTSHRHNIPSDIEQVAQRPSRDAESRDAYLDAARECILDVGWRRTTLTEVARRAGVSRMTIYRAWSDMPALLGDLMTREWGTLVAARVGASAVPTPEAIADAILATVGALRENELFTRIVELDPELILPYLLARRGRSQELIIEILAAAIGAGQAAGTIRPGAPVAMARGLVLAAHGSVLSAHTMLDTALDTMLDTTLDTEDSRTGVDAAALDAELHHLIVRSLQP